MKEKCNLGAGLYFFSSPPVQFCNFCGKQHCAFAFYCDKKNADTFLPRAISFRCYFFVTFIVFNKKIVCRVKPR